MAFILKILLYPFSILYDLITTFRNYLYNIGYKKSLHFDTVVLNVGNLSVGGTGKTPHVEYLIRLLKDTYKIATLSRGYGRKTKGFILADKASTANTIGDEPMQFYLKFNKDINVAVGEERILAIPSILHEVEDTKIIILDDAFQHRKVSPDFNILISDYNLPFYKDYILPAGRLRESRSGARRANAVIISKCPNNLSLTERESIRKRIQRYSDKDVPVFFTTIKYGVPQPLFGSGGLTKEPVLLVSGIAKSGLLETYVKTSYNFFKHLKFNDHHQYSGDDINVILKEFDKIEKDRGVILITEKDMVKWIETSLQVLIKKYPVYYLPIEVEFISEKEIFDRLILNTIGKRLNELYK